MKTVMTEKELAALDKRIREKFGPDKHKEQEGKIEDCLRDGVKELDGMCIKFFCAAFTGLPDRLIFLPGPMIRFVELKSKGKKQSGRQKLVRKQFEAMGFTVALLDTKDKVKEYLELLKFEMQIGL